MEDDRDEGFGLVEIIVSMALLGILLLAVAPLFMGGLRVTAKMTTIATATQLVNHDIDTARADPGNLPAVGSCRTDESDDGRDVRLGTTTCSFVGSRPTLARVTSTVTALDTNSFFTAGQELATATTEIYTG